MDRPRTVYLLRHGEPEFSTGSRVCLGHMDLPLSKKGQEQAVMLAGYFRNIPLAGVYHSPLIRCRETAKLLSDERCPCSGVADFVEVDMGEWDGLSFEVIRRRYPEIYRQRGFDLCNTAPPGGESLGGAGRRFTSALYNLLSRTSGTIAVVAHAGVNRMLLGSLMELDAWQSLALEQPYGCINIMEWNGDILKILGVNIL